MGAANLQTFDNSLCHLGGAKPHGVEDNYRFIRRFLLGPFGVPADNLVEILSPYGAMVTGNNIDLDTKLTNLVQQFGHASREGK
jgi:hypothetical protein